MDKRLEPVPDLFPDPMRAAVRSLLCERGAQVEELRLRAGCRAGWVSAGRELVLGGQSVPPVTPKLLEEIVRRASGYAVYAVQEQLRKGFLTLPGGHRLGVCGTASVENGAVKTIRSYQSLMMRIASQRMGCSDPVAGFVRGNPDSTLILGPPGVGKTTVLRDLVRQMSDRCGCRMALVDERGELAACRDGLPQLDVGKYTDVLTGFPKADAIELLVRTMAPGWIALDEITASEDVTAMQRASCCGVRFFATAHAFRVSDLWDRPLSRGLLDTKVFQNVALIRPDRSIVCERMHDVLLQADRGVPDLGRLPVGGLSCRPATAPNP